MQEQEISIRISAKTAELVNQLREIISSTEGFRLYNSREGNRPDLIIFELSDKFEEEFKLISSSVIQRRGRGLRHFQEGGFRPAPRGAQSGDQGIPITAPRQGRGEEGPLVCTSEAAAGSPLAVARTGEIIYVIGSKGGVGNTTVAVNLATSLHNKRPRVGCPGGYEYRFR